jgi:citrate lyase subunit beta/citryl-CoA lyase
MLLRSLQFVPGNNLRLINSAKKSNADMLIFDLEDSVQPENNKILARDIIKKNLKNRDFDKYLKFVRLNEISTKFFLQDVIELAQAPIDGFLLSKTNTADDVKYLHSLLDSLEIEGKIKRQINIIPILESALSIVNINEIAVASDRIIALGYGSEDFVSDIQGVRDFHTNVSIDYGRKLVPIVARARGLEAIDAAYIHVHDLEKLEVHVNEGKILGYSGMWVLHPKQNEIVNRVYSPTEQEYNEAIEFLELYEEAKRQNKGVAIVNGKFVGPPLVTKANEIIRKMELIKSKNG